MPTPPVLRLQAHPIRKIGVSFDESRSHWCNVYTSKTPRTNRRATTSKKGPLWNLDGVEEWEAPLTPLPVSSIADNIQIDKEKRVTLPVQSQPRQPIHQLVPLIRTPISNPSTLCCTSYLTINQSSAAPNPQTPPNKRTRSPTHAIPAAPSNPSGPRKAERRC